MKASGETAIKQVFHRDRSTWLAYLFLAFYTYFINVLGPITPFLKAELGLSYTVSSLHFTAFAVGILLAGLGGHRLVRHLGRWRSLWIGAFGLGLGVLLLLAGKIPPVTIGASFLMGLVGSLILVIVPSALSDRHGEQRAIALSEANVLGSLVATAAPLMVGWSVHWSGGWRPALGLVALVPALMFLGFGREPSPLAPEIRPDPSHAKRSLPLLFWVYWTAVVLSVAVEFCMIFWSADYLENVLGLVKADAAQSVSLFLGGMIVGRLVVTRLVQRFSIYRVINLSLLVAGLGFLAFWQGGSPWLGLGGLFVAGLGVAGLYPLILALAIGTTEDTVQASARLTLASGTAILTLPLVLGRIADAVGIQLAYGVIVLLLLGVFLILLAVSRASPARRLAAG